MDTSETYIKMCEKAEEIQRLFNPEEFNFLYDRTIRQGTEYKYKEYRTFSPEYNMQGTLVFDTGDGYEWHCIWLPRQDQLQEMVNCRTASDYSRWAYKLLAPSEWLWEYEGDWSVEQLWLAFVMDKLYSKRWNGVDWVV